MPARAAAESSEIFCKTVIDEGRESDSSIRIESQSTYSGREKLVVRLPVTGELLRGSLLERTVRISRERLRQMRARRRASAVWF